MSKKVVYTGMKNVLMTCTIVFTGIMSVCFLFAAVLFLINIIHTYVAEKAAEPSSLKVAYEQALSEEGSVWVAEEIDAWFYVSDYSVEKYGGRAYGKILINNEWRDAVLLDWDSYGRGDDGKLSAELVEEDGKMSIFSGGDITFTENEIIYEGFKCWEGFFEELDKITYKKLASLRYGGTPYWSEDTDIRFELFSDGIFEMKKEGTTVRGFIKFDCYDIILEVSENETYVFNRGENGNLIYIGAKSNNDILKGRYIFY